jgi:hypothetical protein
VAYAAGAGRRRGQPKQQADQHRNDRRTAHAVILHARQLPRVAL